MKTEIPKKRFTEYEEKYLWNLFMAVDKELLAECTLIAMVPEYTHLDPLDLFLESKAHELEMKLKELNTKHEL